MKLKLVTKLDKRNTTKLKQIDNGVISQNCEVNVNFRIDAQFKIWKPDSSEWSVKLFIFIKSNFLSYKN